LIKRTCVSIERDNNNLGLEMTHVRKAPDERRKQIIKAFVELAEKNGYQTVTREQVADLIDVSPALVTRYFNASMVELRNEAILHCVNFGNDRVVAQALTVNDPIAINNVSKDKKNKIFANL